jgi:hypothetical protein
MADWDAVAEAINSRMRERRMTQMEVAAKSGVSIATIREIQHNAAPRRRSPRTLAAISVALDWPSEHLDRVSRGHPGASPAAEPSSEYEQVMSQLDAIQQQVRAVGERLDRLERLVGPEDPHVP